MADNAVSSDPAVQRQLDRLSHLSPGRDILGLERITALMARLGHPELALPPVFHVAGTNGKGSTCAFLRAGLEAAGHKVHVYSSPHLVRFNERIRIAGSLIQDELLATLLAEVLDCAEDIHPSFFEATTAAAFLAFSRIPAAAAVIEVGLGGRLDATNVIPRPTMCGIAQLGIDHQAFLGEDAITIAGEKAGIAKAGVPLVTMDYPAAQTARIAAVASSAGAPVYARHDRWESAVYQDRLHYRDAAGRIEAPLPRLPGAHQAHNAALAFAMLRHQSAVMVPEAALKAATGWAEWPARLQRLQSGPLISLLPAHCAVWLDGGHNPAAAEAIAAHFRTHPPPHSGLHIICGILANKDAKTLLRHFDGQIASLTAIPVPGHVSHDPDDLAQIAAQLGVASVGTAPNATRALQQLSEHRDVKSGSSTVLILGSLYLAGDILRLNDQVPV